MLLIIGLVVLAVPVSAFSFDNSAIFSFPKLSIPCFLQRILDLFHPHPEIPRRNDTHQCVASNLTFKTKRWYNERQYYKSVKDNASLQPWIGEGIYTRPNDPAIIAKAEELWVNDSVYTNDEVHDYINKTAKFVSTLRPVSERENYTIHHHQIPADEILRTHRGLCDERMILFCSLMRVKGIPCQIRTIWADGSGDIHSVGLVWWNDSWYKVDPLNKNPILGAWSVNGRDMTHWDNEYWKEVENW